MQVVLYQPEIPQNTGNIGRTCVAVGAKLWLVRPLGFRMDERYLRRAGLDYWQHLDYEIVDDWEQLVSRLADHQLWYFSKRATTSLWQVRFGQHDVLVFGSETQGLPESLLESAPQNCLQIPMPGPVRSLNLASSVAVAVYEVLRQQR